MAEEDRDEVRADLDPVAAALRRNEETIAMLRRMVEEKKKREADRGYLRT